MTADTPDRSELRRLKNKEYRDRYKALHPDRVAESYRRYRESGKAAERDRRVRQSEHGKAKRREAVRADSPERKRARRYVLRAVERGQLTKGPCGVCGATKVVGHHPNGYEGEHVLDVVWLCPVHHAAVHGRWAA